MEFSDDSCTPPGTPPRRQSRTKRIRWASLSSTSSLDEEEQSQKVHKLANKVSIKDMFKLFKYITKGYSKDSWGNSHLNNVIPEFDPMNKSQTIECWLKKVNECAIIYGWNEKQSVLFSLQKLSGLAKKWFEALPTVVYTWEEWQMKLKKAFPSEENYGRLLEEMLSRTSRSEESLREYFYDKLALLNRCDINGKKAY